MLAVAASASAFDKPVAGTADAPNYYIIKANRGIPYLGYTAEGVVDPANGKTNVYRTNDITAANVWAVTPGTAEGSVVIKSYTADAYLMKFFSATVKTTVKAGGTATTVAEPTDLFLVDTGGAYAININSAEGASYPDNCISLDAAGGETVTCGNYQPTPANGNEGACWWFTKLTIADGQSIEDAIAVAKQSILEDDVKAAVAKAVASLEVYLTPNVPQVKDQIQAGIDQLEALPATEDYAAKIAEIEKNTLAAANAALATAFTDGLYAIKNLRRVGTAPVTGAYLCVNTTDNKYVGSPYFVSDNARFSFKAKDNGYLLYNEATKTYVGVSTDGNASCVPVDEASAQLFTVALQASGDFIGVALVSDAANSNGINWQSYDDNGAIVGIFSITDGGSIFSIVPAGNDVALAEVTAAVEGALFPYVANVPASVKTILEKAIADVKALTYSSDVVEKAAAIRDQAITDANAALATELNSKEYALKYVRGNDFVNFADNTFAHVDENTAATAATARFTFKSAGNGGYKLYNAAANIYVGPKTTDETSDMLTVVTDEAAAAVVYPVLVKSGTLYGIALCLSEDKAAGDGVNMNANPGLHSYLAGDGGSVWGLIEPSALTGIEAVNAAAKTAADSIYDLSGRKLSAPVRGINIINGKKVLVK